MKADEFVAGIRSAVIDRNSVLYEGVFESTSLERVTSPYWQRVLTLYWMLDDANRKVILEIMRQVMIDTVSTVFGILDGTSALGSPRGDFVFKDFVLTSTEDHQKINGLLVDLFFESIESHPQHTK